MKTIRMLTAFAVAALAVSACEKKSAEDSGAQVKAAEAEPAASASVSGETDTEGPEQMSPTVARHMQDHFTRGIKIRDAIIAGDLDAAKKDAQWMAEHQVSKTLPEAWKPHVESLQDAAKKVMDAQGLPAAATGTAEMARACGECHAKLGGPDFEMPKEPPEEASGVAEHMVRHQWAAERMWEALTVPSEEAWRKGAEAMADAPLSPQAVAKDKSVPANIEKLTKEVHDIAEAARADRDSMKWATAYASFLGDCAGCHTAVEKPGTKKK